MSSEIKTKILNHIFGLCMNETSVGTKRQVASQIVVESLSSLRINLPLKFFEYRKGVKKESHHDVVLTSIPAVVEKVDIIINSKGEKSWNFVVNPDKFMKDILESNPTELNFKSERKKVIVEFSSPNIAKPFHAGHLRSTTIGNYLANLKKKLGNDVVKLNYLGDFGTQFGLLKLGIEKAGHTEEALKAKPIELMYDAYVNANLEAASNPEFFEKAKKTFTDLENGEEEAVKLWNNIREWSIDYLKKVYKRINIEFDEYNWESSYGRKEVEPVLEKLKSKGLLLEDDEGRIVAVVNNKKIPLLKSDGSTLYLVRDLAAAFDRSSRHRFNEMFYVVENGQNHHFTCLFSICEQLKLQHSNLMHHIKFGRVHGMSTRTGNVVFLNDIFDEAKELMKKEQAARDTTKVEINDEVADILGTSAVIINDLKQKRLSSYHFEWNRALDKGGDTGVQLQYAHCRLHNLVKNCGADIAEKCDPSLLQEPQARDLAHRIIKFEEAIINSNKSLEPYLLVHYLFGLVHAMNRAYKFLPIKGTKMDVASQRLLLFSQCKKVLSEGMTLLGLKPLDRM